MHIPSLTTALRVNAAFSALSGIAALVLGAMFDEPLGLARRVMVVIGLGLVLYGLQLGIGTRDPERRTAVGRFAVAADTAWVAGAAFVLLFTPDILDGAGRVVLLVATLVVAELAMTQYLGLRRIAERAAA
jgi:hypothetical protein